VRATAERYLSLQEVGDELGVSDQTVRRWVKAGELAAYKPGKEYRIKGSALEEFLKTREVRPKAESRSSHEPTLFNGADAERRLGLGCLRAWRAFTGNLWLQWSKELPATSAESRTLLRTLLTAMKDLVEQGAFDTTGVTDVSFRSEISLFLQNLRKLNEIADSVEQDEAAEERRKVFELIEEQVAA
jgi:excisionase family DNA binding protein